MGVAEPSSNRVDIVSRVTGMLLRPRLTWAEVVEEPATIPRLFLGYVVPLAAIGPVCGTIGLLVFGASIAGVEVRKPSALETVGGGLIDYATALFSTYLLALVVSALAPCFGAPVDRLRAMKLVAYSGTAVWVAGGFGLYPTLGFAITILGALYSLYALYLGLPRLMRAPEERALTYFAAVLVCGAISILALRLATTFLP